MLYLNFIWLDYNHLVYFHNCYQIYLLKFLEIEITFVNLIWQTLYKLHNSFKVYPQ